MSLPDLNLPVLPANCEPWTTGSSAILPLAHAPLLRLRGAPEEARDLLQRLCASDVRPLPVDAAAPGEPQLLLERDGQVLDRLSLRLDPQGALIACTPERLAAVRARIDSMIFMEDLQLEEDTTGPAWLVWSTGADLPGDADSFRLGPSLSLVRGPLPARTESASPLDSRVWASSLLDGGELPLWRSEFSVNPLYTPLAGLISFTKGCYPGQEVIARMDSRGKVGWQLRCLVLPVMPGDEGLKSEEDGAPAKLLGCLAVPGNESCRVLCLVRPEWSGLKLEVEGRSHRVALD